MHGAEMIFHVFHRREFRRVGMLRQMYSVFQLVLDPFRNDGFVFTILTRALNMSKGMRENCSACKACSFDW